MNKFAIVTGASSGIGFEVAKYFAQQGYDLVLVARNLERLNDAKNSILQGTPSANISVHSIDISDAHTTYTAIQEVINNNGKGKVDVLFNSAGILSLGGVDIGLDEFAHMQSINVTGVFTIVKAVAASMKQQKSGYIFNLASLAGKRGLAKLGGYCASKFAVVGLSDSLLKELAVDGIKVTALCPSVVDTSMTKDFEMAKADKLQVSDIVATVDFLLNLSANAVIPSLDIQCKSLIT